MFKGTARIEVFHDDREIEFLEVKSFITDFCLPKYRILGNHSCEWVARDLIEHLTQRYGDRRDISVTVLEDGENGAAVEWIADRSAAAPSGHADQGDG